MIMCHNVYNVWLRDTKRLNTLSSCLSIHELRDAYFEGVELRHSSEGFTQLCSKLMVGILFGKNRFATEKRKLAIRHMPRKNDCINQIHMPKVVGE